MAVAVSFNNAKPAIYDALWLFSNSQAITTSHISENVVNLGSHRANDGTNPIDLGTGQPVRVRIIVTEAFSDGTSVTFKLVTSDVAALSSAFVLAQTPALTDAQLTLGKEFELVIPEGITLDQFVGMVYTGAGTHTVGKVTVGIFG